ncbi:MAG: phosphatidylserine decarboxylase [Burkholderiales bacterium]
MSYPHPIIAREGWPFVAAAVVAALVVQVFAGIIWAWPLWLLALFVLQFFRDPPRRIPGDPRTVLAPADGRVMAVERVRDPWLDRDALRISVFMNVFNVHSNRSPVDGEVRDAWYHPGKFLNAALAKASVENERNALWLRTADGADITCVQVAGLVARRILCYVKKGEQVARGQRFGFIRFGSRVDLYLPPDARPVAAVGDKVHATATILAELETPARGTGNMQRTDE